MSLSKFLASIALGTAFAASLGAQTFPFQLVVEDQNQNTTPVGNGATLNVTATSLAGKVSISLVVTNAGLSAASLGMPALLGSSAFSAGAFTTAALSPGASGALPITFTPASSAQASALLSIPYTVAASGGTGASAGLISFELVGVAPQFVVSYYIQSVQNVLPLLDGGTLKFLATPVGSSTTAVVQIQNNGSGAGLINSVQVTGSAFQTSSLPLLPGTLNTNTTLQFGVIYTPTQSGSDAGTLAITFPDHTVTVSLAGSGTAPAYAYQLTVNGQTSTITPNQTIVLSSAPTVALPFTITVQNTGTGTGGIPSVSLSGVGLQQTGAPASLNLAPGASLSLNYTFTPPQAGTFPGRLQIGNDSFVLAASGAGPQLTYFFTIASVPLTLVPNATVPFSPVQIGKAEFGTFSIQNTGTAPATVISISIPTAETAFSLAGLPGLPVTLAPNATTSFTIGFAPFAAASNSVLQIDSASFNLIGSGTPPPALPGYSFQGAGGNVGPLQQPSIGISLQAPYPLPISGSLTITQNPQGFSSDPAVQFASGGSSVNFTIPANATQAVFPNNATGILMQTGSVANTITVTPSFSFGTFDLTPINPAKLQFTVPSSAPQLSAALITQTSANGFTLEIVGVATSRSLTTLNFTFTAASKFNIAQSSIPVDVASVAANWFQSAASAAFGGQFAISVPFSLVSSSTGVTAALPAVQSVSVTAVNAQGTSNPVGAQIQ